MFEAITSPYRGYSSTKETGFMIRRVTQEDVAAAVDQLIAAGEVNSAA
jgi:hypothetical protein